MSFNSSTFCQFCLSIDRKLSPTFGLRDILLSLDFHHTVMVNCTYICWECTAILKKLYRFKAQVSKALWTVRNYGVTYPQEELKSLSKLSAVVNLPNNCIVHITDTRDIYTETEIKSDNNTDFDVSDEKPLKSLSKSCDSMPQKNKLVTGTKEEKKKKCQTVLNKRTKLKKIENKKTKTASISESILFTEKIANNIESKFEIIQFTEDEMLRSREEKRKGPNFKKIPFNCFFCVLGFTKKEAKDFHMNAKHDEKIGPHECKICKTRFTSTKMLERHTNRHYVKYKCKLCKYETAEYSAVLTHCTTKHEGDTTEEIHCTICSETFRSSEEMTHHTATRHSLECNDCGEKFKGKHTLRTHMRRAHDIHREFTCYLCKKAFKTKSRLESHTAAHGLTSQLAYCAECHVQYKNLNIYRSHLRNSPHHAKEAHQCSDCKKLFASKVYLKKHYNFYHLKKTRHKCLQCNKVFISEWRLRNHNQLHHNVHRPRDHACHVCGKKFFTAQTLKSHSFIHSEERAFMCSECGDTFKQRPALYNHGRLIHKRTLTNKDGGS